MHNQHYQIGQPKRRGPFARIGHLFRERQIYVRSQGQLQFVTIRPYMLVLVLCVALAGLFWIAFSAVSVTFKDELIAAKERSLTRSRLDNANQIARLRAKIDQLNEKLMLDQQGYLSEVDKVRGDYLKLVERQKQLRQFLRQGWLPMRDTGKQPDNPGTGPVRRNNNGKQDFMPNQSGKGGFNQMSFTRKYARTFTNRRRVMAPLRDLRREMAGFETLQLALIDDVVKYARKETGKAKKIYAGLGLNPDRLLQKKASISADSTGGPFVAANLKVLGSAKVNRRMKLAVAELNRAERLLKMRRELPLAMPVANITRITSRFGLRRDPLRRVVAMHTGIDIKGPYASKIRATAAGIVLSAGWAGGYGRRVEIQHANGLTTRYAHMARLLVKKGQRVRIGTPIGLLGSSGRSTGAHLHYETRLNGRAMNPARFWKARRDFQALSQKR